MGAKFVSPTKVTFGGVADVDLACTVDDDCYKVLGGVAEATTDTEKGKRCCMRYGVLTAPSGDNSAVGDAELLATNVLYGVPTVAGEETKYCQTDYPSYLAALKVSMPTYDDKTGEWTADSASGDYKAVTYCDGSAAALQVTAVVGAAVFISMY